MHWRERPCHSAQVVTIWVPLIPILGTNDSVTAPRLDIESCLCCHKITYLRPGSSGPSLCITGLIVATIAAPYPSDFILNA
jgi:hypothetical protein